MDEITGSRTSFHSAIWQDKWYGKVNKIKSYTDMNVQWMDDEGNVDGHHADIGRCRAYTTPEERFNVKYRERITVDDQRTNCTRKMDDKAVENLFVRDPIVRCLCNDVCSAEAASPSSNRSWTRSLCRL
jgi:hypothetical protein